MILKGDCIKVMKAMKPNSVDAIVTDPPYNLHFLSKDWDKDLLHEKWLIEAYQVLKPGGSMLVMGGTRTSHRLACAIEDSGFIIKDTLMWIFGSGFPKAQEASTLVDAKILGISTKEVKEKREVIGHRESSGYPDGDGTAIYRNRKKSKGSQVSTGGMPAITRPLTPEGEHWDGFKVGGIKPAYEPIIWAVKPPEGSYVDNVLKHGVGAVNVEETRISINGNDGNKRKATGEMGGSDSCFGVGNHYRPETLTKGRFPANIILSHHPECVQVGMKKVKPNTGGRNLKTDCGKAFYKVNVNKDTKPWADPDGYETVESWDCHPDCAVRLLDEQSGDLKSGSRSGQISKPATNVYGEFKGRVANCEASSGGASRFFKQCNYGQEEWLCHEGCVLRRLDEQSGELKSGKDNVRRKEGFFIEHGKLGKAGDVQVSYGDNGGASRFYYCAKASRAERNAGLEGMEEKRNTEKLPLKICIDKRKGRKEHERPEIKSFNNHPTVKPIKLFEWLIKLVTREGQIILDPFIGSGTTVIAAHNIGRKCIGIEKEEEYIEIAGRRVAHWESEPKQMEMRV